MSESRSAEDVAGGTRAFAVVAALFVAGCLAAGYGFATSRGQWPLGHPWAAFVLSGLGVVLVVSGASRVHQVLPLRVLIGATLAAAVAWLFASALVG